MTSALHFSSYYDVLIDKIIFLSTAGGLPWTTARTLVGPVLDVHKKEMTIDLGSDLVLTCTGKSNLTWAFSDVQVKLCFRDLL